jgi:phosphate/sulfate permease
MFLAVVLTDVIMLDIFNSLGLPTSTTVSLIFELLGSSVCIALFKISHDPALNVTNLAQYINGGKALGMISGILVSVVIAFVTGSVVMYVTRLLVLIQLYQEK